jgi:hypothetical protein
LSAFSAKIEAGEGINARTLLVAGIDATKRPVTKAELEEPIAGPGIVPFYEQDQLEALAVPLGPVAEIVVREPSPFPALDPDTWLDNLGTRWQLLSITSLVQVSGISRLLLLRSGDGSYPRPAAWLQHVVSTAINGSAATAMLPSLSRRTGGWREIIDIGCEMMGMTDLRQRQAGGQFRHETIRFRWLR